MVSLNGCLASEDAIEHNSMLAKALGISGTPGFIVGTELVPGAPDVNGLKELIARAQSGN